MDNIKEEMKSGEKLGNEQFYDLLTSKEISWQSIIYDLINTNQLDPWDIDIALLSSRYLEKIKQLEEANFFVSSKVLLAASILLRIKSELLLYKYMKSIDEILFGKKEVKKPMERIEIDESELPFLYPKTPLPRYRKVSLNELMLALENAIKTEGRRIKKEVARVQEEKSADIVLPKSKVSIKDRIRKVYGQILTAFKKKQTKVSYSEVIGTEKEERIACFLPVLHLDSQQRLFLEQEKHFDEIWIWLYSHYKKNNPVSDLPKEISQETGFENPLADFFSFSA
ncbi:segregation/condensation protein A [Candidatus Pacearchaeota archaeon]|nr:segregation/condensation protein A [Candidatus Pacearchaeota archaeon]